MNQNTINSPTNAQSILSLVFGILALLLFCIGLVPFPLTDLICYPISFLFAILALVFGSISLGQIRRRSESGSPMVWVGIISAGFVVLCMICMIIVVVALFMFAPDFIHHMPPFIQKYLV
jgi:hypothetical protein